MAEVVNTGALLPDSLILDVLHSRLHSGRAAGEKGVLLDGFPRTRAQVRGARHVGIAMYHARARTCAHPDRNSTRSPATSNLERAAGKPRTADATTRRVGCAKLCCGCATAAQLGCVRKKHVPVSDHVPVRSRASLEAPS